MIGVGCDTAIQCTPYHTGKTTCIDGCCCTVPESYTSKPNLSFEITVNQCIAAFVQSTGFFLISFALFKGYCYNGQLSQVRCSSRNQCGAGQTCMNGLCCTTIGDEYQYTCGGIAALGSCADNGTCTGNMHCNPSNYCCECPVGRSSGLCNEGVCPSGFICNSNGYCCASCPNNETPYGACRNGVCGDGSKCVAGNICCFV
ncbi:unnamed protein product [Enterobius vermicularis]|uniref:CC domain-containing protein n=1 Tax=Enterobius vermicularis TaxID=51028 RepID=A0A0N4VJ56_ENTVE|nr:unnamed protein product [Enterobius vermicularis]